MSSLRCLHGLRPSFLFCREFGLLQFSFFLFSFKKNLGTWSGGPFAWRKQDFCRQICSTVLEYISSVLYNGLLFALINGNADGMIILLTNNVNLDLHVSFIDQYLKVLSEFLALAYIVNCVLL